VNDSTDHATPKYIFFDLGNVLLTFDHRTACHQLSQLVDRSPEAIWEVLFASGLQARYEQGAVSSAEIYEAFCHECCDSRQRRPSYEAFHRANSDIFALQVPVVAIVSQLFSAGYPLGILSNTCEEHWKHVAGGRFRILETAFRQRVLSFEVGSSKPERRIYDVAAERVDLNPGEIFFLDDRVENVEGARQAGWDAVLFESPQRLAADLWRRGVQFNY